MADILVKDVMKQEVETVDSETSVLTAVRIMRNKRIGSVIVVEDVEAVGIVTTTDVLYRLVAEGKDIKNYVVKDVMSGPLISIDSNETIKKAAELMAKNSIKKLPVIESNGGLSGIITTSDLIAQKSEFMDILVNVVIPGKSKYVGS